MIQKAGPKDFHKKAFINFAAMIFSPGQAKIVLHHIAGAHAVSPLLHTVYAYRIDKAVTLNNSLATESSTFTFGK